MMGKDKINHIVEFQNAFDEVLHQKLLKKLFVMVRKGMLHRLKIGQKTENKSLEQTISFHNGWWLPGVSTIIHADICSVQKNS